MFQVADLRRVKCPLWAKEACYMRFIVLISLMTIVSTLYTVILILFIIYRKQINLIVKNRFRSLRHPKDKKVHKIIFKYCEQDREFVLNEVIPVMNFNVDLNIKTILSKKPSEKVKFINKFSNCFKDTNECGTIVLFSSNYLMSTYSHVDIKKIHSEMLKAENTIYIFADIGPENSIYAFLEEQRDVTTSLLWNEDNFWENIFGMLAAGHNTAYGENDELQETNKITITQAKMPSNISFKLPDCPNMYNLNTLTHSQV